MQKFIELLKEGALEEAQKVLKNSNDEEQKEIIEFFAHCIQSKIHVEPKTISILYRTLKPGKTYADFVEAWQPQGVKELSSYFDLPVQVMNASNLKNSEEVISIGLVQADEKQLMETWGKYQESEAMRRERIAQVAEGKKAEVYKVLDIVTLGL